MEEIDPKFTRCLVKQTKYWYKKEFFIIGMLIVGLLGFAAMVIGFEWVVGHFTIIESYPMLIVVALDFIIMGLAAYACARGSSNPFRRFISTFIKFHVLLVAVLILFAIEVICLFGVPITTIALTWIVINEIFGFSIGILSAIIVAVVVSPISYSAFICFKIDPFIDVQFKKVLEWL